MNFPAAHLFLKNLNSLNKYTSSFRFAFLAHGGGHTLSVGNSPTPPFSRDSSRLFFHIFKHIKYFNLCVCVFLGSLSDFSFFQIVIRNTFPFSVFCASLLLFFVHFLINRIFISEQESIFAALPEATLRCPSTPVSNISPDFPKPAPAKLNARPLDSCTVSSHRVDAP